MKVTNEIIMLKPNDILLNPDRPSFRDDEKLIDDLAGDMSEEGFNLATPLVVRLVDDQYMIVAGTMRLKAAIQSRLEEVPCILRNYTAEEALISYIRSNKHSEQTDIELGFCLLQHSIKYSRGGKSQKDLAQDNNCSAARISRLINAAKVIVEVEPEIDSKYIVNEFPYSTLVEISKAHKKWWSLILKYKGSCELLTIEMIDLVKKLKTHDLETIEEDQLADILIKDIRIVRNPDGVAKEMKAQKKREEEEERKAREQEEAERKQNQNHNEGGDEGRGDSEDKEESEGCEASEESFAFNNDGFGESPEDQYILVSLKSLGITAKFVEGELHFISMTKEGTFRLMEFCRSAMQMNEWLQYNEQSRNVGIHHQKMLH